MPGAAQSKPPRAHAAAGAEIGSVLPIEKAVFDGLLAIIQVDCPAKPAAFINHFGGYKLYDLTP